MKERGYLTFWPIFTAIVIVVFGIPLIVTVYLFLHINIFPNGILANLIWEDNMDILEILAVCGGLGMLILGIPGFIRSREAITAATTLSYAPMFQDIVTVINKVSETQSTMYWAEATYTIVFEFPGRTRKAIEVELEQYNLVIEGDVGMLSYKMNKYALYFVGFEVL